MSSKNYVQRQTLESSILLKLVEAGKNLRQARPEFLQMVLERLEISEEANQVKRGMLMRASISHR